MTTLLRAPRTVVGLLIALVIAAPVAGCGKKAGPPTNGDNAGAGQIGDAPAGGQDAGGTEPTPPSPTLPPAEDETPDPGTTVGPAVILTFDPGLLIPWPSPADCLSHNPATLTIKYTASGPLWQIADGSHYLLAYKREVDAQAGLALAKAYKKHCFIGRNNTRADRERYIMDYWLDPVEISPAIASPDCLVHKASELKVMDLGALGWRVEGPSEAIALFDSKADADKAVLVMRHYNRHCYVGRGYGGADRLNYITNWFASV